MVCCAVYKKLLVALVKLILGLAVMANILISTLQVGEVAEVTLRASGLLMKMVLVFNNSENIISNRLWYE